jgi:hypothetical protein
MRISARIAPGVYVSENVSTPVALCFIAYWQAKAGFCAIGRGLMGPWLLPLGGAYMLSLGCPGIGGTMIGVFALRLCWLYRGPTQKQLQARETRAARGGRPFSIMRALGKMLG